VSSPEDHRKKRKPHHNSFYTDFFLHQCKKNCDGFSFFFYGLRGNTRKPGFLLEIHENLKLQNKIFKNSNGPRRNKSLGPPGFIRSLSCVIGWRVVETCISFMDIYLIRLVRSVETKRMRGTKVKKKVVRKNSNKIS
jgi:hypothetical protein